MKTLLAVRNVHTRLQIAYMAHACYQFKVCEPSDTIGRWLNADETIQYVDGKQYHPYTYMWLKIGEFYDVMGFANLSDKEIDERFKGAFRVGFTCGDTKITATAVQSAVNSWRGREWTRYEERRNARRSNAWKVAPWGVSLTVACLTGVFINPQGGA